MPLHLVPPIHRATHRIGLYLADLREHGLSQGEAHILAQLAEKAPATIKDLHQGLAHKRSTLTSILDRLAARGFITREVGAADRRTFVITLTPKGRRVARRVHEHLTGLERAIARRVSPSDVSGFLNVIRAVEEEARRRTEGASAHGVRKRRATVRGRDRQTPSASRQPLP
jgi:DNA-binding MarR family transcriptional regulator